MKLPIQKKILREDVKEAPPWVDKLLYPINSFFETVFSGLSKNLTFSENIACQIKEIEFNTTGTYDGTAANWVNLKFNKTIKTKAQGVWLLQIIDLGNIGTPLSSYRPIEGDVCIDWMEDNGQIIIGLIRGLAASKTYSVRFLVM